MLAVEKGHDLPVPLMRADKDNGAFLCQRQLLITGERQRSPGHAAAKLVDMAKFRGNHPEVSGNGAAGFPNFRGRHVGEGLRQIFPDRLLTRQLFGKSPHDPRHHGRRRWQREDAQRGPQRPKQDGEPWPRHVFFLHIASDRLGIGDQYGVAETETDLDRADGEIREGACAAEFDTGILQRPVGTAQGEAGEVG